MTEPREHAERAAIIGHDAMVAAEWVVVIETAVDREHEAFEFSRFLALLVRLREWGASGLFSPRRYALQLRTTASAPDEALRRAVAYHDLAAQAVGLNASAVTRAEVLTLGEFGSGVLGSPGAETGAAVGFDPAADGLDLAADSFDLAAGSDPAARSFDPAADGFGPAGKAGNSRRPLISNELYAATRALLQASSPDEITEVVVRFVTAVGGSVNVGECRPTAGMIAVDITVGDGPPLHAVAESLSLAGEIIEHSLPSLAADAHAALRHLDAPGG